jgi:Fe-S cluster assembly protein SufB
MTTQVDTSPALPGTGVSQDEHLAALSGYKYGWHDSDAYAAASQRGLSEEVVRGISAMKHEPEWMLKLRLKALRQFQKKPMPTWGVKLDSIDFDQIKYFVRAQEKQAQSWEDLPADIKNTYDRLGIPEAEKDRLVAGVAAQYESEVVYHKINEELGKQGVIFLDTDTALREQPELFKEYFASAVPVGDNKFAALNTAVWSGGSFIYVPKGVHCTIPLQAYFRMNTENLGQFERTLIVVDEGAYVHYVEGCTAPIYKSDSLHAAVVEIIVKKNARCRYTTIQNWSNNVYNLVTQRAYVEEGGTMEWIDGNIGSKSNMKYPACYLMGEHAKGEALSVAFAAEGQHQDTGAKMVHYAPYTSSTIVSKSISQGGGRSAYRGLVAVGQERPPLGQLGALRCAAGRRHLPLGHLPLQRRAHRRGVDGPRGHRLQGERGAAVLPDAARPHRGGGDGHDRARIHRADRQGAPDGVRPGAQPAHRDPDGGCGRLIRRRLLYRPHHRQSSRKRAQR